MNEKRRARGKRRNCGVFVSCVVEETSVGVSRSKTSSSDYSINSEALIPFETIALLIVKKREGGGFLKGNRRNILISNS